MSENLGSPFWTASIKNQTEAQAVMRDFIRLGEAQTVFSAPVTQGNVTIITASETMASLGFGYALGGGSSPGGAGSENQSSEGGGGGGGGGGYIITRPVAAIILGPDGVRVEPIFDLSKLLITFVTALFTFLTIANKVRRGQ